MTTDLYAELGVGHEATTEEIKRAFRRVAMDCHPDKAGDDQELLARYARAREAYETLGDPEKRRLYDRGARAPTSIASLLCERPLGQAMVERMLPSAPKAKKGGVDAAFVLEVPAEMLATGGTIAWPEYDAGGRIERLVGFSVPPGADARPWCLLPGLGEDGRNGGDPGDLLVLALPA